MITSSNDIFRNSLSPLSMASSSNFRLSKRRQHLCPMVLILYHRLQVQLSQIEPPITLIVRFSGPDAKVVWVCETTWFAFTKLIQTQLTYNALVLHSSSKKNKFLVGDGLAVYFQGTLHLYFFSKLAPLQLLIHIRHTWRFSFTFTPEELWSQLYYPRCLHCRPSDLRIHAPSPLKRSIWPNPSRGLA